MQQSDQAATIVKKDKRFPVIEVFGPTIQGEGNVIGLQTAFVRFGGCDYRCERCDSLHAVLPALIKKNATMMTAKEIFDAVIPCLGNCSLVTFSGGNPCMWDLTELVYFFNQAGIDIAVETQGTLMPDWLDGCTILTVSPKGPGMGEKFEHEKFNAYIERFATDPEWFGHFSVKIVIFDQRDIQFAVDIAAQWPILGTSDYLFLSVGNPWPPAPASRDERPQTISHAEALLERMKILFEDIQKEPMLRRARFLPQLHCLLWSNEQGR